MNATIKEKLSELAEKIAKAKRPLHFMALVHRENMADRWDLLISSDQLSPWSLDAIRYVDSELKKTLTSEEGLTIATIVPLAKDNEIVVQALKHGNVPPPVLVDGLHPSDYYNQWVLLWPKKLATNAARAG